MKVTRPTLHDLKGARTARIHTRYRFTGVTRRVKKPSRDWAMSVQACSVRIVCIAYAPRADHEYPDRHRQAVHRPPLQRRSHRPARALIPELQAQLSETGRNNGRAQTIAAEHDNRAVGHTLPKFVKRWGRFEKSVYGTLPTAVPDLHRSHPTLVTDVSLCRRWAPAPLRGSARRKSSLRGAACRRIPETPQQNEQA